MASLQSNQRKRMRKRKRKRKRMAAHQASTTSEGSSQCGRGALWIHSAVKGKKREVSS
jgi:hypothetical protein